MGAEQVSLVDDRFGSLACHESRQGNPADAGLKRSRELETTPERSCPGLFHKQKQIPGTPDRPRLSFVKIPARRGLSQREGRDFGLIVDILC